MEINSTIESIPRSGIRRIMDLALAKDPDRKQIIHLEVGMPNEETHPAICEKAAFAALHGYTKYTPNLGLLELRQAIAKKLREKNLYPTSLVNPEHIFVVPGATYGISIVLGVLLNHGDEVLVPDPGYPNFSTSVAHFAGTPVHYQLSEEDGFSIDCHRLEQLITSKTKVLIINSPSNPTGAVLSREKIIELTQLAKKHNLWILSDEVYEHYIFGNSIHYSPIALSDYKKIIAVYSFSKSYNMTGFRVGYVISNHTRFCESMLKAQEMYISCAPAISQIAAIEALNLETNIVQNLQQQYSSKFDLALGLLKGKIKYRPQGAFYILINITNTSLNSNQVADRLLEEACVAVAPGATFGPTSDAYIRIALTANLPLLKDGIQRILNFINSYEVRQ
ncbi:MAG: pyridoxal phosphate-dependent aminotransferase [Oligoflexia bacterium]|nr:pyridoxal phosphate-dependent aminotransferase [Oligoflexia bacterium]